MDQTLSWHGPQPFLKWSIQPLCASVSSLRLDAKQSTANGQYGEAHWVRQLYPGRCCYALYKINMAAKSHKRSYRLLETVSGPLLQIYKSWNPNLPRHTRHSHNFFIP